MTQGKLKLLLITRKRGGREPVISDFEEKRKLSGFKIATYHYLPQVLLEGLRNRTAFYQKYKSEEKGLLCSYFNCSEDLVAAMAQYERHSTTASEGGCVFPNTYIHSEVIKVTTASPWGI